MKNKKILVILVLIMLGIVLINPIKKEIYSIQFKIDVKELLSEKYKMIDAVEFSGNYKLNVDLNMSSEFCTLNFLEQKPIIKSISNDLEDLYILYRDKVNKIDNNINSNYGMIKFKINDYFYNTCFVSSTIYKNGNTVLEYTDKDYLIERIKSKISSFDVSSTEKDYVERYLNEIDNIEKYKYILDIKDNNTLLREIAYQYLSKLCNDNKYSESIFYYKSELANYKDSTELFNKMIEHERNREKEYLSVPRIGMTKKQVLKTTWGIPKMKAEDNPNSIWRVDNDGEEAFFYVRGTTRIMVSFKNGTVDAFYVTKKGDVTSTKVYSVEGY